MAGKPLKEHDRLFNALRDPREREVDLLRLELADRLEPGALLAGREIVLVDGAGRAAVASAGTGCLDASSDGILLGAHHGEARQYMERSNGDQHEKARNLGEAALGKLAEGQEAEADQLIEKPRSSTNQL